MATAMNERHADALLDYLKKGLKPQEEFLNVDSSAEWVAIDLGDIIVHIMQAEFRQKLALESFLSDFSNKVTKYGT